MRRNGSVRCAGGLPWRSTGAGRSAGRSGTAGVGRGKIEVADAMAASGFRHGLAA